MANQIVQQIRSELESFQKELNQFKQTAEYLSGAKQTVSEAIGSINATESAVAKKVEELKGTFDALTRLTETVTRITKKLDGVNFPERLDNIEETVKGTVTTLTDTKEATLNELQKASKTIIDANFEGQFKELLSVLDTSNDKTKNLIQELNIPVRLDKIDTSISGTISAVQITQTRLDTVERNLGEKTKDGFEKQAQTFSNLQIQIQQNHDSLLKKQQINAYVTWALVVIGCVALVLLI